MRFAHGFDDNLSIVGLSSAPQDGLGNLGRAGANGPSGQVERFIAGSPASGRKLP
jgi:hypothetical protein